MGSLGALRLLFSLSRKSSEVSPFFSGAFLELHFAGNLTSGNDLLSSLSSSDAVLLRSLRWVFVDLFFSFFLFLLWFCDKARDFLCYIKRDEIGNISKKMIGSFKQKWRKFWFSISCCRCLWFEIGFLGFLFVCLEVY